MTWLAVAAEDSQGNSLVAVLVGLVACGVIGVFVWNRQRQPFRSGEVEQVGRRVVARDETWDEDLGRRYFILSFMATGLLAVGVLLAAALDAAWGVIPVGVGVVTFIFATMTLTKARGISAAAARVSGGPWVRLPIVMARRHGAGTWWERWAWVDVVVLTAAIVASIVLI